MDVRGGCCWRCEKSIQRMVMCSSCGEAKYCSETCRFRDQWRHTPECEEWRPKQCSNPNCSAVSKELKECTACCKAWYCGSACQRHHWKDHKPKCQERTQEIMQTASTVSTVFKNHSGSPMGSPYYIGNALEIDMLNLTGNECSEEAKSSKASQQDPLDMLESSYSILSAGCGNLRNWIHTVTSLPKEFKGTLKTVLNDFNPYVQARNVLHLYIMIVCHDESNIAQRIATVWYSLHLPKEDYKLLVDSLTKLLSLSAEDLGMITGGILQLTEADMSPMRGVWKAWLGLECRKDHQNYIDLSKQRRRLISQTQSADEGMKLYRRGLPEELLPSFDKYDENGDFTTYEKSSDLRYDNPTLTGYMFGKSQAGLEDVLRTLMSPKLVYCVEYDLTPFGEWDFLQVKKHAYSKSMVSMFHAYISNQISDTIKSLKSGSQGVSIIGWNCLEISERLNKETCQFDRIFTSNIADYSGTQTLLKVMKPFLRRTNKHATIITQHWNWYFSVPQATVGGLSSERMEGMAGCGMLAVHDINSGDEAMLSELKQPLVLANKCKEFMLEGRLTRFVLQEYFNNTAWFVSYLRAEYLALEPANETASPSPKPPSFQKLRQSEGLQLRDFRRGNRNRIVPFRYRRRARLGVNMTRGMDRMLEWHLP